MCKAEVELTSQIKPLLEKAKATDVAETYELDLDIPEEIKRREKRHATISAAKARLEARQTECDLSTVH